MLFFALSDRFIEFVDMTFRAMWVQGRNLNDPEVLNETLKEAGFDPAQVLAWVNDPSVKDRLKSETEAAVARGIFGAPSMFVGSALYFGQDRLDFVREALTV